MTFFRIAPGSSLARKLDFTLDLSEKGNGLKGDFFVQRLPWPSILHLWLQLPFDFADCISFCVDGLPLEVRPREFKNGLLAELDLDRPDCRFDENSSDIIGVRVELPMQNSQKVATPRQPACSYKIVSALGNYPGTATTILPAQTTNALQDKRDIKVVESPENNCPPTNAADIYSEIEGLMAEQGRRNASQKSKGEILALLTALGETPIGLPPSSAYKAFTFFALSEMKEK